MIPKNVADFIIAVTGNRIECELREVGTGSVLRVGSFEGARPRLAPVPCNSDYKIRKDSKVSLFCAYSLINTSALFTILWYPM